MFKYTKIVATIGPACNDPIILEQMIKSGVNVARLNFSHGSYENHQELFDNLRKIEKKLKIPITIMQDLQGPKIRIGEMPEKGLEIKTGAKVEIDTSIDKYDGKSIPLDYPGLEKFFKPGERILIDDGHAELTVEEVKGTKISCIVVEGYMIKTHKGLNLPDTKLNVPILSDKDRDDLRFGVKMGVDVVALSFVHNAEEIRKARYLIEEYEKEMKIKTKQPIFIVVKVERREAMDNIEEIVKEADGVMVARGDLAMEIKMAELPLAQKRIIDLANSLAHPVIVATQMMDSMQKNRRPTRAEISDVANAVIDHADALMLSNETAVGMYPDLVIKTMVDIILTTEKSEYDDTNLPPAHKKGTPAHLAIAEMSRILADEVDAKLILAASLTGETGRLISHVRPALPIIVATDNERSWRQLNLSWGVQPFILPTCKSVEELVEKSVDYIKAKKIAKKGDKMIIVAGDPVGQSGTVNLVEVREIK